MSTREWTLECVNHGAAFRLPEFNDKSLQTTIDLLEIKVRAEHRFKDLKPITPPPTLPEQTGDKELDKKEIIAWAKLIPHEWIRYNQLFDMQVNLETAYYLLHKIDPSVTKEAVSALGDIVVELVADYFTTEEPSKDPQQAAMETPTLNGGSTGP